MSITLLQLRNAVRQRADMENSNFVSDTELTSYINSSIAELHDLLISCYGSDYFTTSTTFQTTTNTSTYSLATIAPTFYKLKGVDILLADMYYTLQPFNWNERNRNTDGTWGLLTGPNVRYRLVGSGLEFSPPPEGQYTVKFWYIPVSTKLVADGDIYDDLNQYAEYVITDAAIKCMQKEESDVTVLAVQKQALTQRIQAMANNRDADKPDSISDIYTDNDDYWFYRSWS